MPAHTPSQAASGTSRTPTQRRARPGVRNKSISLDVISVATPCTADWQGMTGDAKVRHCEQCDLNVYNLSDMTRSEAEALIAEKEGRLCVRYYRRADGTVLTQDCPVGLAKKARQAARRASRWARVKLAGAAVLLVGAMQLGCDSDAHASGQPHATPVIDTVSRYYNLVKTAIFGGARPGNTWQGQMLMGEVAAPPPAAQPPLPATGEQPQPGPAVCPVVPEDQGVGPAIMGGIKLAPSPDVDPSEVGGPVEPMQPQAEEAVKPQRAIMGRIIARPQQHVAPEPQGQMIMGDIAFPTEPDVEPLSASTDEDAEWQAAMNAPESAIRPTHSPETDE